MNISLFANFRIDSAERLHRMRDSLDSIRDIKFSNYVVNIRGSLRKEARLYIEQCITEGLIISEDEDSRGWMDQSLELSEKLLADYIFIWVEDHIFTSTPELFSDTIWEAFNTGADFLYYSFLTPAITSQYLNLEIHKDGFYSTMFSISEDSINKNLPWFKGRLIYTSSLVTIVSKSRFKNRLSDFSSELLRWPHETPFNFERIWAVEKLKKVIVAIPKNELFVSIDDDLDFNYSLISRGLYPNRVNRNQLRIDEGLTQRFLISIRDFITGKKLIFINIIFNVLKSIYFTIRYKFYFYVVSRFRN